MIQAQPHAAVAIARAIPATPSAPMFTCGNVSTRIGAQAARRTSKSAVPAIAPTRLVIAAADHIACRLLYHLMDVNDASCPRMPLVNNLALLSPVGVPLSCCTTTADRTNSVREARLRARRCADRGEVAHNRLTSHSPIMKFLVVCLVAHASELHRWATAGNVKLLLPPRQSPGNSLVISDEPSGRTGSSKPGRLAGAPA